MISHQCLLLQTKLKSYLRCRVLLTILVQKYHPTLSFDHLISKNIDTSLDDKDVRLIKLTQRILNKEFGGEDIWPREIMRIHYQTSEEKAMSELMTDPLNTAIEYLDHEEVLRLSSIYGFSVKFKDTLRDCEPYEIIKIMSQINNMPTEEQKNWNEFWLSEINHRMKELKIKCSDVFDKDLVSSIKNIKETTSLELNLERIKYECRHWLKKLEGELTEQERLRIYDELYQYYELSNDSNTLRKINNTNFDDYIDFLWPNRDGYADWNINLRKFNTKDKTALIEKAMERELNTVNDLLVHFATQNKINNKDSFLTNNNFDINSIDINDDSFASFLYSPLWGTEQLDARILKCFNIEESEFPEQWVALAVANSIISKTYIANEDRFINYMKNYPDYHKYLSDYLTFSKSYNNLLSYISDDIPSEISSLILKLFIDDRVHALDINELLEKNYNNISKNLSKNDLLLFLNKLANWKSHLKKLKLANKWPSNFVEDILTTQTESWLTYLIQEIENKGVDSWESEILTTTKNTDLTIKYYQKQSKTLESKSSKALSDAIKSVCRKEDLANLFLDKFIKILAPLNKNGLVRSLSSDISKPTHKVDISEKILIIENISGVLSKIAYKDGSIDVDKIELLDSLTEEHSKTILWLDKQEWDSVDNLPNAVKDDFLRLILDINKKEALKQNLSKFIPIAKEHDRIKLEGKNITEDDNSEEDKGE